MPRGTTTTPGFELGTSGREARGLIRSATTVPQIKSAFYTTAYPLM